DGENGVSVTLDEVSPLIEDVAKNLNERLDKLWAQVKMPEDGKSVTIEEIRPIVKSLIDEGLSKIKPAKDGEDGKDATHIEILPEIDEEKSYSRNIYASHNGGLWRSFEKTFGMRGWECLVNGIAEIVVEQVESRKATFSIKMSNGQIISKEVDIP